MSRLGEGRHVREDGVIAKNLQNTEITHSMIGLENWFGERICGGV